MTVSRQLDHKKLIKGYIGILYSIICYLIFNLFVQLVRITMKGSQVHIGTGLVEIEGGCQGLERLLVIV